MGRYLNCALALIASSCGGSPRQPSPEPEPEPSMGVEVSSQDPPDWVLSPRWYCTWAVGKPPEWGGSCHNERAECDKDRYVALDRGYDVRRCEPAEHVHCFVQYDDTLKAHCLPSAEECQRGRARTGKWFRVGHCAKYGQRDSEAAIVSAVRGSGPDPDLQGPTRPLPASMTGTGWWCHSSDDVGPMDMCKRSEPECEQSRAQLQDGRFKPCSSQARATCVSWREVAENRISFACHATEKSCAMMRRFQANRPGVDRVGACAPYE